MGDLKLVTVGHIMKEIIQFPDKTIGPVLGSPTAYSSVAASVMGTSTGLVTIIGNDMPDELLAPLRNALVNTMGICVMDCCSRLTILIYDSMGNKKVIYEQVPPVILPEHIPSEYLKSEAFLFCPMDFEIPVEVLDYVRGNSSAVMMADLGGFGGSVSIYHPGKEYANETTLIRRIVSKFDIVKASIEDCMYIFSSKISSHEAAQLLVSWGAKIVIITLGEEGSVIFDGYDFINILPYRTKLVDTTGAGDVYCAAFISEFIKSKDLKRAGLYASSAASYIVERTGGVTVSRMPSDSEVLVRVAHLEVLRD